MTIETQWLTFSTAFLPENVPEIQIRQLRIAFYAGAAAALNEIGATPTPDKAPTRAVLIENMAQVSMETTAFAMEGKFQN